LRAANLPEEAIGAIVLDVAKGSVVLAHRETQPMPPASTLKLLTSIVALERLGPDYRARTQLRTNAEVIDGVLRGDLILQGGGDVDFDWRAFERQLSLRRLQGIREIAGDLVLDLSWFRPTRTDIGLEPFDESPEFRYNVIPDALLVNTYLVHLDIVSTRTSVRMATMPVLTGVTFVPEFELIDGVCQDWDDGWKPAAVQRDRRGSITVRLRGTFPRDCKTSTAINVLDRVVYADRLFRALWGRLGGKFSGTTREGVAPGETHLLGEHLSRSLAEIARDIDKVSDNPIARVAYLNLGAMSLRDRELPTAQRAEREVRAWLASRGIDANGLVLDNGSGLSRSERIAPADLAAVLKVALSSRWAPEFLATLPIVGLDGSMRMRLTESTAAARGRIKTGTLRDVSAVAGYVEDASGRMHIVVAMIHHEAAHRRVARPILDALIDWVARQ
jgi:D-alanyl-D-alanine carboxypeptidase/D-alanyl-D-alanine-endopeptidase (penicillin-binding protein 4)